MALVGFDRTGGEQPKTEPAKAEPAKARIVPVVALKPGESKELLLSTSCTVGITRSGGLDVREIGDKGRAGLTSARVWKRNGIVAEVPDFDAGEKEAAKPKYESLRKAGVNVFSVKVMAAKDAKPGVYNLHLADFTCNGTCETDFRVLVVAP
jgi:hypothetical protein